ncbi:hypothetical protein [Amycolatopsis granulosa]|uniref:hypothetical protein n=1 Tax=Amycolatopsis granulosa TaxID=185684 RepID=UPI00141EC57A|nr:hypothetical protein [Amycolatopsis granulosa]NIH85717.1 hypothetical protein [Amycolatopsis granulosa]
MNATTTKPAMLRATLRADGWGTAAFGVLMLTGSGWLAKPLGLPLSWFAPIGAVMIAGGAALGYLAERHAIRAWAVRAAVLVNTAAAVAILALLVLLPLTAVGVVFLLAGAAWVTAFAVLEHRGSRRPPETHEGRSGEPERPS